MLHIPSLYIMYTKHGRGVSVAEDIAKGDLIEICPIVKIPAGQLQSIDKTILYEYYFLWEEKGFEACIALGYGSLYNHSPTPNAEAQMDYQDNQIRIIAKENITAATEITIDYTGGTKGEVELWF